MEDFVHDDEVLYRCVFFEDVDKPKNYVRENGGLRIKAAAFIDRNKQISVDRANLCDHNPTYTQKNDEDGIVMFIAFEVRAIADLKYAGSKDKLPVDYVMNVVPVPEKDNPAHAELRASPHIDNNKVFRKLRRMLEIIVNRHGWLIKPEGFR